MKILFLIAIIVQLAHCQDADVRVELGQAVDRYDVYACGDRSTQVLNDEYTKEACKAASGTYCPGGSKKFSALCALEFDNEEQHDNFIDACAEEDVYYGFYPKEALAKCDKS